MSADGSITNLSDAVADQGALPMPVCARPVVQPLELSEQQIEALAAAGDRVVNDAVHEDLCACDAWPEKCVSTAHYFMGAWDVNGLETALPAVLGLWESMRGGELEKLRALVADFQALELGDPDGRVSAACGNPEHPTWLRKPDDARACPWCEVAELEAQRERRRVRLVALQNDALSMRGSLSPNGEATKVPFALGETLTPAVDWLIARVAELDAERHVTNEALDDVVQELRRRETGPALPWAHSMSDHDLHGFLDDLVSAAMGRWRSEPEVPDRTVLADIEKVCAAWRTPGAGHRLDGSEFDGATVRLVEPEGEFYPTIHHSYRLGHDLPETGGTQ